MKKLKKLFYNRSFYDIKEEKEHKLIAKMEVEMVFDQVKEIILAQLPDLSEDDVTMDANFITDLGADSIDVVEMVMAFEEEFGVEIPEENLEGIKTVADVVNYFESL